MAEVEQNHDRLLGVWNLEQSLMSLGDLLILLADLKVISELTGSNHKIDIAIVGDYKNFWDVQKLRSSGSWKVLSNDDKPTSALLEMILGLENIENCYFLNNTSSLQEFLNKAHHLYRVFPEIIADGKMNYDYGFTDSIRDFYDKTGTFPYLSCKEAHLHWAQSFLNVQCGDRIPIVLHLKNTIRKSGKPDWYNARFEFWVPFLKFAEKWQNIVFILIGNEALPEEIRKLPNTIISLEHGGSLIRDLALIQKSCAFMGMASGPSNMAIFGPSPYVIFKTPGHHQQWIDREIDDAASRLKFARDSQRFLIQIESLEILKKEFERICSFLHITSVENVRSV